MQTFSELVNPLSTAGSAERRYLGIAAKLCEIIPEEELLATISSEQVLRRYGVIGEEGRVNKSVVLALVDAIMRNEVLKEEVLNYILKCCKAELIERIGGVIPRIELKWSEDFERWLLRQEARLGKPISPRTLADYKRIWSKCLEGKVLGWRLLKQLSGKQMERKDDKYHPTGWARQIIRHYVKYLYSKGKSGLDINLFT